MDRLFDRYAVNASACLIEIGLDGSRRELTHADLAAAVRARADDLAAAGLQPGQVIGIKAKTSIEWVVWDLAALEAGAVLYAIPEGSPLADPQQLVAEEGLFALISDAADKDTSGPVLAPGDRLRGRQVWPGAPRQQTADLHSFTFSSGTSGSLKGLRISRSGTECVISRFIEAFKITAADRHLIFLPMSNYQQRLSVYCCLWAGADLVLAPFQRVFAALPSEHPRFLIAPPVFYDSALQLHRKSGKRLSLGAFFGRQIRFMITGMAPIRRATLDAFWNEGIQLLEAYGMTETGMIAWNTPAAHRVGTVGRLIDPGAVDMTTDGELIIKAAAPLSLGYFKVPEGTAEETFQADGSIVTGDFGVVDAEGFLTLKGRRKDVITLSSGLKVNPAEIEEQFAGIGGIAELVVVTTGSSGRLGAVVVLPADAGAAAQDSARAAIEKVNTSIPVHQRLSSVAFVHHPLHSDPRFQTANLKLRRSAVAGYFAELISQYAFTQLGMDGARKDQK